MLPIKKKSLFFLLLLGVASSTVVVAAMSVHNRKGAVKIAPQVAEAKTTTKDNSEKPSVPAVEKNADIPVAVSSDTAQVAIADSVDKPVDSATQYPIHKNISTTFFWAGEEAGKDNKNISNLPSAWDEDWVKHFGGIDSPKKRSGFSPAGFAPKENTFYFALPYNDFDEKGQHKNAAGNVISWASAKKWGAMESICKNQWIKITKNGKVVYAQWEDVGPFGEDDTAYVFGSAQPKSKENEHAGLDVSPAVRDYLALSDIDTTDWQFVAGDQVPDGPWKKVVTVSQVFWK